MVLEKISIIWKVNRHADGQTDAQKKDKNSLEPSVQVSLYDELRVTRNHVCTEICANRLFKHFIVVSYHFWTLVWITNITQYILQVFQVYTKGHNIIILTVQMYHQAWNYFVKRSVYIRCKVIKHTKFSPKSDATLVYGMLSKQRTTLIWNCKVFDIENMFYCD